MKTSDTYQFKTQQWLPANIQEAWKFFSSPINLTLITPPELDFRVLSKLTTETIFNGMQIDYSVRPLFRIPVRWKTEILQVQEEKQFMDRQMKGPYKRWEHMHQFIEKEGGVLMIDEVNYQLPFGGLGKLIHHLVVRRKVESIFEYRRKKLDNIFSVR